MSKILIVDDEENVRKLVKNVLSNYGYEVAIEAADGEQAIEKH